jgi:hypothetical protein
MITRVIRRHAMTFSAGSCHRDDDGPRPLPNHRRGRDRPAVRCRIRRQEIRADHGETEVIDQSHLHGLLGRIADLGLTLLSVTRLKTAR